MSLSKEQTLVVVSAANLYAATEALTAKIEALPNAKIVSMVLDNQRLITFTGGITVLAAVSHD